MSVSCQIAFKQGVQVGAPGVAIIGTAGVAVTVSNGNNANVQTWKFKIVDVPPTSTVTKGVVQQGTVATYAFTPDVAGGYLVLLTVTASDGTFAEDLRVFQIAEASGRIIPPFAAPDTSLNFVIGGVPNLRGWAKFQEEYNRAIDAGGGGGGGGHVIQSDGADQPAEARLNFSAEFLVTDNAGVSTDVALNSSLLNGSASPSTFNGRMTLTSGTPITTADVVAGGFVYFTPYGGNVVSLPDLVNNFSLFTFTELSIDLTGQLTSGKNYDIWIYNNAGTPALELGQPWTDDVTRFNGITTIKGVQLRTNNHTRRLIGTIRATGTGTTEDSKLKRFCSNANNQVLRQMLVQESNNSWSYTTAAYRAANGQATNCFEYVNTLQTPLTARASALTTTVGIEGAGVTSGIGIDSTTVSSAVLKGGNVHNFATVHWSEYEDWPGVGYHKITWLEYGGAGAVFYGNAGNATAYQMGMMGKILG